MLKAEWEHGNMQFPDKSSSSSYFIDQICFQVVPRCIVHQPIMKDRQPDNRAFFFFFLTEIQTKQAE